MRMPNLSLPPPAALVYWQSLRSTPTCAVNSSSSLGIGTRGLLGNSSATKRRNAESKPGLPQAASAKMVPPPGSTCFRRASMSSGVNDAAARPWK